MNLRNDYASCKQKGMPGGHWRDSGSWGYKAVNCQIRGNTLQAYLWDRDQWRLARTHFEPGDEFDDREGKFEKKDTSCKQKGLPGGSWASSAGGARNCRVVGNTLYAELYDGDQHVPASTHFNPGDTFKNWDGRFEKNFVYTGNAPLPGGDWRNSATDYYVKDNTLYAKLRGLYG